MRILLIAAVLFITIHFIRIDLAEGTIPMASFAKESVQCDEIETLSIPVTSVVGDTIESLFALYPDPSASFIDRLSEFYSLNPHLQLQDIVGGEKILLPLSSTQAKKCTESRR
ncbi:hypothetical protein [Sporosarcina sp. G11-34]|uniref:hypothetical protein n=1 Tax=Sporosarcina sp. G11-34 TaxID=2849605 RepID=UPI0022A8ECD6|nr:hypothetical protein [Sporosarcina sp. G11-34]MCZ2260063.1 hypothetical protein [Sporosarcina sp. G11-34]